MTVESTTRKQSYAGGQSALTFTFRALPNHPEDIKVIVVSSGTETLLTYPTQYSVTISTDGIGGVVVVAPSFSTSYTYTVYRETTNKQESDYDDYNQFPADTLEEDIDRRTLVEQEIQEAVDRSVKFPVSSTMTDIALPSPEAGKALKWNDTADGLENTTVDIEDAITEAANYASTASTQATAAKNYATTASTQATAAGNYASTASTQAAAASSSVASINHVIIFKVIEDTDSLNTGDGQFFFVIPAALNGSNLAAVAAHVYTVSTSGLPTIQIRNVTDSVDMLSTKLTIDANESDSKDALTPAVIDTTKDDVATGDVLAIDVDVAGTGTLGLEIRLQFI